MNIREKTISRFVAAALLLTAFAGVALAQGATGWDNGGGVPNNDGASAGCGYGFVDEDGDGTNDRYPEDCDGVPDFSRNGGSADAAGGRSSRIIMA